jgi:hypothetical protein
MDEKRCFGTRRLARKLLVRRAAWRRRVVGSMLAGMAVMVAVQLALGESAAAPAGQRVACAASAMTTAAQTGGAACRPAFASAATTITLGGSR